MLVPFSVSISPPPSEHKGKATFATGRCLKNVRDTETQKNVLIKKKTMMKCVMFKNIEVGYNYNFKVIRYYCEYYVPMYNGYL